MKTRRNDELWMSYLNTLKEYINTHHILPTNSVVYNGINLGSWLRNQISAKNRGDLPNDRLKLLNEVNQYWDASNDIKIKENHRLMISDYEINVKPNFTSLDIPIDKVCKDEAELYTCLLNKFYTCEDLLKYEKDKLPNSLHPSIKMECYEEVFPFVDMNYARLLGYITGYRGVNLPYSEIKTHLNGLAVRSADEMRHIYDDILDTLNERDQKVIRLRFGLDDRVYKTQLEVAKIFNVSSNRIHQIEASALRRLRHPSRIRKLYLTNTNTILDNIAMSKDLRAELYRMGIDNEEKIFSLYESASSENNNDVIEHLRNSILEIKAEERKIEELKKAEIVIEKDIQELKISEINLSTRSYNCLRRAGINTVADIEKKLKNPEDILKIRNLGRRSLEEICDKLNELYHEKRYNAWNICQGIKG